MNKKIYIGIALVAILATTSFSENNNLSENSFSEPIIVYPSRSIDNFKEIDARNLKNKPKNETSKIVNGVEYTKAYDYWLPPEPNSDLNNSTLLGVDINNNKVRDDIERKIVMNPKWSAGLKGAKLQEARTYFLAMESPEKYPHVRNLLDKAYDLEYYYEDKRNITPAESRNEEKDFIKSLFNTDERKLVYAKIQGKFSGTVTNVIYQPHRFVERYADYTVSKRGTLKDYTLKDNAYDNKPIPYYSESGNIQGYINNGEARKLTTIEFCETNYGMSNYNNCKEKINKQIELEKIYSIDELIKQGIIHE